MSTKQDPTSDIASPDSYGPRATLLMSTSPIFTRIIANLPPDQQSTALLWSKSTYAAVLKVRWRVIDMVRFRRYHPMFSDPRRSILFHAAPTALNCRNYVPLLHDPALLSYYLALFPSVVEVYDNSYRLKFGRRGADIEEIVVYVRKDVPETAHEKEGEEGRDGEGEMGMKLSRYNEGLKGLPKGWEVELREEE